jgi:hypothetical protein
MEKFIIGKTYRFNHINFLTGKTISEQCIIAKRTNKTVTLQGGSVRKIFNENGVEYIFPNGFESKLFANLERN